MAEKRRSMRIRPDARVDVVGDSEVLLFQRIRDLGEGGMSIEYPDAETLGDMLDLSLTLPTGESLDLVGEVVRVSQDPVCVLGIRFVGISEEQKEILRRYLQSEAARRGLA
ncbi:MAG TPA: PilZ domain-containing protein [Myxococcota bacterium]|nr:PilZ domain-containing protein [Myxococcota bacterium]HQK50995.1 PilZ domain-containing protein [Myxococcota bacterium]